MITVDDIRRAQALINADERGAYMSGSLGNVFGELHLSDAQHQIKPTPSKCLINLYHIFFDIENIATLIERIEWTRQYAMEHPDFSQTWRTFASVDIEHFHFEFRSIFDYVACVLQLNAKAPKSVSHSYHKLYEWLKNENGAERTKRIEQLGQHASELVLSSSWFMDFCGIRDSIIHWGSQALIFGRPEDGTLFQIQRRGCLIIRDNISLVNENNVADFELYSAFWLTHLFLFLEEFATIIGESLDLTLSYKTESRSGGFAVIQHWMDKLASKLSGQA